LHSNPTESGFNWGVANLPGACPVKYIEDVERSEFNQGGQLILPCAVCRAPFVNLFVLALLNSALPIPHSSNPVPPFFYLIMHMIKLRNNAQ
jgi:hypothetical protein